MLDILCVRLLYVLGVRIKIIGLKRDITQQKDVLAHKSFSIAPSDEKIVILVTFLAKISIFKDH